VTREDSSPSAAVRPEWRGRQCHAFPHLPLQGPIFREPRPGTRAIVKRLSRKFQQPSATWKAGPAGTRYAKEIPRYRRHPNFHPHNHVSGSFAQVSGRCGLRTVPRLPSSLHRHPSGNVSIRGLRKQLDGYGQGRGPDWVHAEIHQRPAWEMPLWSHQASHTVC